MESNRYTQLFNELKERQEEIENIKHDIDSIIRYRDTSFQNIKISFEGIDGIYDFQLDHVNINGQDKDKINTQVRNILLGTYYNSLKNQLDSTLQRISQITSLLLTNNEYTPEEFKWDDSVTELSANSTEEVHEILKEDNQPELLVDGIFKLSNLSEQDARRHFKANTKRIIAFFNGFDPSNKYTASEPLLLQGTKYFYTYVTRLLNEQIRFAENMGLSWKVQHPDEGLTLHNLLKACETVQMMIWSYTNQLK